MSSDPASSPGRPARRSLLKVIGGGPQWAVAIVYQSGAWVKAQFQRSCP